MLTTNSIFTKRFECLSDVLSMYGLRSHRKGTLAFHLDSWKSNHTKYSGRSSSQDKELKASVRHFQTYKSRKVCSNTDLTIHIQIPNVQVTSHGNRSEESGMWRWPVTVEEVVVPILKRHQRMFFHSWPNFSRAIHGGGEIDVRVIQGIICTRRCHSCHWSMMMTVELHGDTWFTGNIKHRSDTEMRKSRSPCLTE